MKFILLLLISFSALAQPLSEKTFFEDLIIMEGVGATKLQAGTTAQRPTPTDGMMRFNTDTGNFEFYSSGFWVNPTDKNSFADNVFAITSFADPTKTVGFDLSALTAATTRTYIAPNSSGTLSLLESSQSFTGLNTFTQDVLMVGTGQFQMPVGTTAQRALTPLVGMQRYNTDLSIPEVYDGVAWVPLGASTSIVGPASSTDNAVVRYDGVTGKLAQDSAVIIDDVGRISQTGLQKSVFIGVDAGLLDDLLAEGKSVAIGQEALRNNSSTGGKSNIAMGFQAGRNINGGDNNIAIGTEALERSGNINNSNNVAIGSRALWAQSYSTSKNNTAIGHYAQRLTNFAFENTSVGAESLENNLSASRNTAMGFQAGTRVLNHDNTAVGHKALGNASGGDMARNVVMGSGSGSDMNNGKNNILLGYDVETPAPNDSFRLNIGDYVIADMANKLMGIGVAIPTVALDVDGSAKFTGGLDAVGDMTAKTLITIGDVTVGGIGRIQLPSGTTAERPAIPIEGMMRFNNQLQYFEGFNGAAWVQMETGAAASGDVVGPIAATDNAITRYDGITGKIIQDSLVLIDDTGFLTAPKLIASSTIEGSHPCPTMTEVQRDAVVGMVAGDCITNSDTGLLNSFDGSVWKPTGGLTGPAVSTDNAIARYDGVLGEFVQDSSILIDDLNNITGVVKLSVNKLEVISTTEGSVPCPKMTEAQRDLIGPLAGECIFNTDIGYQEVYSGTTWSPLGTLSLDEAEASKLDSSTGLTDGGQVTVGAPTTTFSVAAGFGYVVDTTTDPSNPTATKVTWAAQSNIVLTNIAANFTTIAVNSAGTIVQKVGGFYSPEELRDFITLAIVVHVSHAQVDSITHNPRMNTAIGNSLSDLASSIGSINRLGNMYSPNGANLSVDKTAGETHALGTNYVINQKSPNIRLDVSASALTFAPVYQDGSGGTSVQAPTTFINPSVWDDGTGVLDTVGNNNWSIKRVYYTSSTSGTFIAHGQFEYANLASALQGVTTESFITPPALIGSSLRGWLVVKGNATDLSDVSDATFVNADKFGSSPISGGTPALGDLQGAYDNSLQPQITVDAVRLGMQFRDAATPIASPLFQVLDNAAISTYFEVSASQNISISLDVNGRLETISTTEASLPCPVMTEVQRDALTPVTGDCVYNSDTLLTNSYNGTGWGEVGSASTFQDVYTSSAQPQISLNSTQNGMVIRDHATPIGVDLLSIQTNAGSPLFSVDAVGSVINGKFSVNSTVEAAVSCPVMTTVQRDLLTAAEGECIYNSTTKSKEFYNGTNWLNVLPSGIPVMTKGSLFASNGLANGEFTACADGEILEFDVAEATGFKCVTVTPTVIPLLAKGELSIGDGSINNTIVCADDELIVWDSAEAKGAKCEAKPVVVVDTNAGTICSAGQYLDGDGTCKTSSSGVNSCSIITATTISTATAICTGGKIVTGGGCNLVTGSVLDNYPITASQWRCTGTGGGSVTAYAICCNP